MAEKVRSGAEIRQEFIDFFVDKYEHTYVPSSSLVPGGDQTLLFTNAGMVQFKDIFLGTDKRSYTRAVNSQKVMRVAGKHNDLEDVGRDDTHHTFFEMLGNWSFGDYYKAEAIAWAWELLTDVWGLPKASLWATVFRDEKSEIPQDDEAAEEWRKQPGMNPEHILYFGRADNFWEMADKGPCGPCSEIHLDRGLAYCDQQDKSGHVCEVNGDCQRFLELWNLVFIQYNRLGASHLEPLPATHVDTGMGFERIVSVLQDKRSNYSTDVFSPLLDVIQELARHDDEQKKAHITPYRVIADHARAAAFLIADGVVPGNMGRNYVCRMIIRRAARFGANIGLKEPFLSHVAERVIENYSEFYPELSRNQAAILFSLTDEEQRFQRTVEGGLAKLENYLVELGAEGKRQLSGEKAFDLYATFGLPLEITRDIAQEEHFEVDEVGFNQAMEAHRALSGAGEAFGPLGGEDVEIYRELRSELIERGILGPDGVAYNPYDWLEIEGPILGLVHNGELNDQVNPGDKIEVVLPETGFYLEAGGQVSDTGNIYSSNGNEWEIKVSDVRKPAAGIITHKGEVVRGNPKIGDTAVARVDIKRRRDIMRNHTATHLLHAELHRVLGDHARQAGSLVAPDRLRFDFTHNKAVTPLELQRIEDNVNRAILDNYHLNIEFKSLQTAIEDGAIALFGEKYDEEVRNITIGEPQVFSNELCGGTHVNDTGDIGLFLIISEGSVAAGIRRIEAVTGFRAYELAKKRFQALKETTEQLGASIDEVPGKTASLLSELNSLRREIKELRKDKAALDFESQVEDAETFMDVSLMAALIENVDADTLREFSDRFRQLHPSGVVVLASVTSTGKPILVAAVTDDLVKRGLHAGELVKYVAQPLGGSGGGRPSLAQAGGNDSSNLQQSLNSVKEWVADNLK